MAVYPAHQTNMRLSLSLFLALFFCTLVEGQNIDTELYSKSTKDGVIIQNGYNRGGPYTGPVKTHFNVSNLVYYTRIINKKESPIELTINFTADPIAIPNSPDTFVKVFLASDTMTLEKRNLFNYGVKDLESFDQPTEFKRKLNPNEDCLFNVVAIFYQTVESAWSRDRGGNRSEFVLKGKDLYFRMPPQINSLHVGHVSF